jgi:ribosome maturation factor RimP
MRAKTDDTHRIEEMAREVARDLGVELYDLRVEFEGPRKVLRVFLEKEGGVLLGEITSFSRRFAALLEVEDPVEGAYVLEVSSPGLNRQLTRPSHFLASSGRRVRVILRELVEGCRSFTGSVESADDESVVFSREGKPSLRVPYALLRSARIEVSQEELFGKGKGKK